MKPIKMYFFFGKTAVFTKIHKLLVHKVVPLHCENMSSLMPRITFLCKII